MLHRERNGSQHAVDGGSNLQQAKYYLKKLHSDHSKHELKNVRDEHYVANGLNGNDHAFHYRLGQEEHQLVSLINRTDNIIL